MSFSFGSPSSAPASSGLTSGFNFGANKPATPGFGLSATTQPSTGLFGGTPATAASTFASTSGFGTGGAAFGTGTPAFGAAAPAFGATAAPAFGATAAAPAFGTTGTPAFGTSGTPAFGATSVAPSFGATSTAPAFGSTTAPAFGATGAPAFGTGLGTGGLNFGAGTNATASTGLTLGAPAATTTNTGLGGLGGFGFTTTTTQSAGLGGFFNTTSTAASGGFFGPKPGLTTVTSSLPSTSGALNPGYGLGGLAPSGAANTTTADGKTDPPKQTKLPNEISTTVDIFKEFVKKQKSLSSDVMRVSIKPLHKVSREAETTLRVALSLSGEVSKARAHSRRLRSAAAAALASAETVSSTPGSELEGTAPPVYIKDLISELEQQLITFRRQMDVADKQMQASPKLLTEQELTLGIRRMHESLVALAGRLQAVHTQVEAQKEQYLNLRKYILKDPTNVFELPAQNTSLDQILRAAEGTRKKTKSHHHSASIGSAVLSDPRAVLGNLQQLAGPTPFTYIGSTLSPFAKQDNTAPSWQPQPQPILNTAHNVSFGAPTANESSTFQLQKPPGKRGKQ